MNYSLFGISVQIDDFKKPQGYGSMFEDNGTESLKSIGLENKFYFQAPNKFSLELPTNDGAQIYIEAANDEQQLLAIFLMIAIRKGELMDQYYIEN